MKPLTDFIKRLHSLTETEVEYGYDDKDKHPESGLGMAELASIHEYGKYGIPERKFMSQTFTNMVIEYKGDIITNAEEYLYYGGNISSFYSGYGKKGVEMIRKTIDAQNFEPLSPVTIEMRDDGSETILDDSGYMKNNAKYEVKKKIKGG